MNTPAVEKGISEIVGALTDPIIVFPGGWGDTIPEWLKTAITLDRMMGNMKALKGEESMGTDAEVCAYLMTLSLTQPMDSDWTQIYLYVASKTCAHHNGSQVPEDIQVDSINDYQMTELNRLKEWLYRKRTQIRLERDRTERRQKREEESEKRKTQQPALFSF